ncbi:MAG TPA: hypothetical protein VLF93_02150 [Candidatus Saccharimonadales bacterium]|nr:hypothetical protein [Candidatus Saccharimonadales bacterium]
MSAEAPVRQKRKLDVQVVTNNRKEGPGVAPAESLVGKAGELMLGVPLEITGLDGLRGTSVVTINGGINRGRSADRGPTCGGSCDASCPPCV